MYGDKFLLVTRVIGRRPKMSDFIDDRPHRFGPTILGKFEHNGMTMYIDGYGFWIGDYNKFDDNDYLDVICIDGQWYKVRKKDLFIYDMDYVQRIQEV